MAIPLSYQDGGPVSGAPHRRRVARGLEVGDVAFGYKRTVHHDLNRGAILSLGAEAVLARVREDDGSFRHVPVVEPFAAYAQLLPGDAFVQTQALVEFAVDGEHHHAAGLRVALGRTWTQGAFGRAWTPMLEVLAERDLTQGASTQVDLAPQVQVSLNTRQHVLLNVGVRIPAGGVGSRGAQVVAYLLWDWFDGGFLDGW